MTCLPGLGKVPDGYGLLDPLPRTSPAFTSFKERRLRRMAKSGEVADRIAAASNPNTPHDALKRLAHDPVLAVRSWVARNPAVPRNLLEWLSLDSDAGLRQYAKLMLQNKAQ